MQKWEYLTVSLVDGGYLVNYEHTKKKDYEGLLAFIQQAGDEGWEMTAAASHVLYFKRPKN